MRRFYALVIASGLTVSGFAQQAQPSSSPVPTLRTSIKLVVVDVTVTDLNHRPLRGLKAEDFALLENNASQVLKSFDEHQAPNLAEIAKAPAMPALEPGNFTNFTPQPALTTNGPVNILLIDRLNTPSQSQTRLREQLLTYLSKAKPGARTAVYGLGSQLVLLQGFTTNPAVLRSVMERKGNSQNSPLLDSATATGGASQRRSEQIDMLSDQVGDETNLSVTLATLGAHYRLFEATQEGHQTLDRARRTLDALNALARYLVDIPGRKNLVWFSGSFPLDLMPDVHISDEFAGLGNVGVNVPVRPDFFNVSDVRAEYRETLSLLSRAQVVLYPVDARGANVLGNVTVAGEGGFGERYLPLDRRKAAGATRLSNDIDTAMENNFNENTTMRDMAFQTGGRAFLNDNDLAGALSDALEDGSNYYTLTYSPSDGNWRGDYRKIEVKLRAQGYEVSYRRGYYADDPAAPPSKWEKLGGGRAVTTSLSVPDFGAMHLALLHAAPEPLDIVLHAHVVPSSDKTEDDLAPGNSARKGLKGPYRRYVVDLSADVHSMDLTAASDGLRHGSLEFVTFVYDAFGNVVSGLQNAVQADIKPAVYDKIMEIGLPVHQEVSVPAKGEYFLRIVVHDLKSGRVGAVEVPIVAVSRLQPTAIAEKN